LVLEVVFGFELIEDFGGGESDGDGGISGRGVGVVVDVDDVGIVGGEGFEDIVVVVKIEGDGSQCFSP
jgi:hypothetical protein